MMPFLTLAVITGLLSYSIHKHGIPELGSPAPAAGSGSEREGRGGQAIRRRRRAQGGGQTGKPFVLDTLQIELG